MAVIGALHRASDAGFTTRLAPQRVMTATHHRFFHHAMHREMKK
jgi:hypothetical protein